MSAFRPLDGIRVLDLTNVLSGPLACYQLAALGADVIKVEPVGQGDLARQLGDDVELNGAHMGASFLAQNAGKRSVTLNLKSPEGVGIFFNLVKTADVVVENFRPGVMDRLGVGYERLREERPDLIYCAISGFGQKGPLSERPAYDQIIQGAAGVMSVTGESAERPLRVGYPMADSIGGLTAAMVICGALVSPKRGAFIDVSMMSSVMATMGWAISNWLTAGSEPRPIGNENATSAPSGAFRCKDGLLNITANKQEQWEALAHYLELGELIEEPQFRTRDDRKRNRTSLLPLIEAKLAKRYVAACADELTALVRGTLIGSLFGALPGIGSTIATIIGYAVEKRISKDPSRFGRGAIEGIVSPEAANNAGAQTAFIPTLSLGIPGSATMAVMLGTLIMNGIAPGPQLMVTHPEVVWGLAASFWIGNVLLLVLNIPLIGLWVRLLRVPYHLLYPAIIVLICIGTYTIRSSIFDIMLVLLFGVFGYWLRLLRFQLAPVLIGFILGPMIEENFRRAMLFARGDLTEIVARPLSGIALAICVVLIIWAVYRSIRPSLL